MKHALRKYVNQVEQHADEDSGAKADMQAAMFESLAFYLQTGCELLNLRFDEFSVRDGEYIIHYSVVEERQS